MGSCPTPTQTAASRLDENGQQVRAVLLYSGGLDSTLAALLLRLQGVEVLGVNMSTGFCTTTHRRAMGRTNKQGNPIEHEALGGASRIDIPIEIIDIREGYLDVLAHPKHGWGSAANPCIDCRIFMFRRAEEYRLEHGAHFLATGEVLGQRPMTQMKRTLKLIEREAGVENMVVRPLSQRRIWESIPEQRGWVARERLLDLQGRGRSGQLDLARELEVVEFPQPAGGCCFLTDHNYALRLKELMDHRGEEPLTYDDVLLLKVGRQFRLPGGSKLVVGRDEAENGFLERMYGHMGRLLADAELPGPVALLLSEGDADLELATRIVARYAKRSEQGEHTIRCWEQGQEEAQTLHDVQALDRGAERPWMLA